MSVLYSGGFDVRAPPPVEIGISLTIMPLPASHIPATRLGWPLLSKISFPQLVRFCVIFPFIKEVGLSWEMSAFGLNTLLQKANPSMPRSVIAKIMTPTTWASPDCLEQAFDIFQEYNTSLIISNTMACEIKMRLLSLHFWDNHCAIFVIFKLLTPP